MDYLAYCRLYAPRAKNTPNRVNMGTWLAVDFSTDCSLNVSVSILIFHEPPCKSHNIIFQSYSIAVMVALPMAMLTKYDQILRLRILVGEMVYLYSVWTPTNSAIAPLLFNCFGSQVFPFV